MFRLSKFIDDQLMWSIENQTARAFSSEVAEIMQEMTEDSRLSLRVERI